MSATTRIIVIVLLLVLAIGGTVFAAASTVQAFYMFQQQSAMTKAGDVQTIRSWMTVPYIAHVYHVPENELYHALSSAGLNAQPRTTLHALALRTHKPVNQIIHEVQQVILTYRQEHPQQRTTPTSTHQRPHTLPPVRGSTA